MAENEKQTGKRTRLILWIIIGLVVVGIIGGGAYFYVASKTIEIDDSTITAPLINLSPVNSGILQAVYVLSLIHISAVPNGSFRPEFMAGGGPFDRRLRTAAGSLFG